MSTQPAPQGQQAAMPVSPYAVQQRTLAEIVVDLSKHLPDRHLKKKPVGRGDNAKSVPYIPWHMVVKYLDYFAPGWTFEVTRVYQLSGRVCVAGRLTLYCADGTFFRDATGQEEMDVSGYGDPTSNAEGMCIRRCAAKFGLGLYLYALPPPEQSSGGQSQGQGQQGHGSTSPPITAKQLNYARSLAGERGVDLDGEANKLFPGEAADTLTIAEAKRLIDHLLSLPAF
jgi:hypothetical protein